MISEIREALIKSARAGSERFFSSRRVQKWRNTVCISHFRTRTDREKDPLSSRRRFIQSFLRMLLQSKSERNSSATGTCPQYRRRARWAKPWSTGRRQKKSETKSPPDEFHPVGFTERCAENTNRTSVFQAAATRRTSARSVSHRLPYSGQRKLRFPISVFILYTDQGMCYFDKKTCWEQVSFWRKNNLALFVALRRIRRA